MARPLKLPRLRPRGACLAFERSGGVLAIVVTRILSSLSAIPAFGADIQSWIKVLVAVQIVVTIIDLVLLLKPNRLVRDQQATTTQRH